MLFRLVVLLLTQQKKKKMINVKANELLCLDRFQTMPEAMHGFLLMGREGNNFQEEILSEYI